MRSLLFSLIAFAIAGCGGTRACRDKTVLLDITLSAAAANAASFDISVSIDGGDAKKLSIAHKLNSTAGTIELDFTEGYPAGKSVAITITAVVSDHESYSGSASKVLSESCAMIPIAIGDTVDASPSDSANDSSLAGDGGSNLPDGAAGDGDNAVGPVRLTPVNKVDLLFMIDNSPSMAPKQTELRNRFPDLIKSFQSVGAGNVAAWYHIGVVTSDLGAGQYNLGGGQCHPNGDGAKLQAVGQTGTLPGGAACGALGGGVNFIDYNLIAGTNNLPSGQSLNDTFNCMASVGDRGCGFEFQLESVYDALTGVDELGQPIPANTGFLRDDALLVVVWVTDEDDCSAPPTTDLFDPAATKYGAELSYRCTNYSIMCGSPPMLTPYASSGGPLAMCTAADQAHGDKLYDLDRFIKFFTLPKTKGGVKNDPNDVILATLAAPAAPVEIITANPNPNPPGPYQTCTGAIDGKTCAVVLQHSCVSPTDTAFFGDPAVRISQVVGAAKHSLISSICDTSYLAPMQQLGSIIAAQVSGCFTRALADPAHPDCQVEDITTLAGGTTMTSPIASCASDGGAAPCWQLVTRASCPPVMAPGGSPQQFAGMTITRPPGYVAPPGTITSAQCRFLP